MVKLPWFPAYFPVILYPFYWLFLICFYFIYLSRLWDRASVKPV